MFLVGSAYRGRAPASGRLWLNMNADAYSDYTVDNSGGVHADIAATVTP